MEEMTTYDLKNYLQTINEPKWFGMETLVPKKMNDYLDYWVINNEGKKKKNPNPTPTPFKEQGIWSYTRCYKMMTGFDYVESVKRRRVNEDLTPEFQNEDDKEIWFNMVSKGLVVHKDNPNQFYFRYQRTETSVLEQEYRHGKMTPIEKHLFESFLTQSRNHYENQGLEHSLRFEVVKLENIIRLNIDGRQIQMIR